MSSNWKGEGLIVGIRESTNGRSCMIHNCCGNSLAINDVVNFSKVIVNRDGAVVDAI